MENDEILREIGLRLDYPSRVGMGWRRVGLADVPPALRVWVAGELVAMMQAEKTPAYVWERTP